MDPVALAATREHYNRHSGQESTSRQQREQGVAIPLKKFHNQIKRRLINRFAYGCDSLLDLACGRGGDILKWIDAKIKFVKGVDLSPGEIEEARRRFSDSEKKPYCETYAEFEDTDQLGLGPWEEPQQYDTVTCMFAIHYFFVTEVALKTFMQNVSVNLKDGGYFFGTCPDGKGVLTLLNKQKEWVTRVAQLHARWQGSYACFGSAFSMAISDTVTEGHEVGGVKGKGSFEYLVFRNVLEGVAAKFNLFPVKNYGDPSMDDLFLEEDRDQLFKHFKPHYPHSDPDLEKASGVNVAFCFQKRETGKEAGISLPPLPPDERGGPGSKRRYEGGASGSGSGNGSGNGSRPRHQ